MPTLDGKVKVLVIYLGPFGTVISVKESVIPSFAYYCFEYVFFFFLILFPFLWLSVFFQVFLFVVNNNLNTPLNPIATFSSPYSHQKLHNPSPHGHKVNLTMGE